MKNQKGGFYVKIHRNMFDNLVHLSGEVSNTACAVIGLNTLGIDRDIIQSALHLVGKDGLKGLLRSKTLQFLEEYMLRIKEGKTSDRNIKYIKDMFDEHDSFEDPNIENSEPIKAELGFDLKIKEQKKLYDWLKKRIPLGTATLLFLPGHVAIVGKTGYAGDIFIIDPQLEGDGGKDTPKTIARQFTLSTMNTTRPITGIHRGLEAVGKYLSFMFRSVVNNKDRYISIPHRHVILDYREPQMPTEQIFSPPILGRTPSVKLSVEEILINLGVRKSLITIAKKTGKKSAQEILNHIKTIEDTLGISAWEGIFIPEIFNINAEYKDVAYDLIGNVIDKQGLEHPRDIELSINEQIKEVFGERGPEIIKEAILSGRIKNMEELVSFYREFESRSQLGGSATYVHQIMKPRTKVKPGKFALKK